MTSPHVRFQIGEELFAIDVAHVTEVGATSGVVRVPSAGPLVLGICNLRGSVLPVFDGAGLFEAEHTGTPRGLLVLEHRGRFAGVAIDAVLEVGPLGRTSRSDSALLEATARHDDRVVGVLRVDEVFDRLARAGGADD